MATDIVDEHQIKRLEKAFSLNTSFMRRYHTFKTLIIYDPAIHQIKLFYF